MIYNYRTMVRMVDEAAEAGASMVCGHDPTDQQIVELIGEIIEIPEDSSFYYNDDNMLRKVCLDAYLIAQDSEDRVKAVRVVKQSQTYRHLKDYLTS